MSSVKIDMQRHIHPPENAVSNALQLIKDRIDNPKTGIGQHIPGASEFLMPWYAGELVGILGYTSNGKSSFANYMVTQHAYALRSYKKDNPDSMRIIVYCTWEQSIEEQTIHDLSRVTAIPFSKIIKGELKQEDIKLIWEMGAPDRMTLPVWLIGSSIMDDRRRERFTMEDIRNGLMFIENEMGAEVDLIVLDYLQRIRRMKTETGEMREGFINIVDAAKDMALKCPVILVSQAKREVLSRQYPLPELDDAQETSNFEQSCDHVYSVCMPKQMRRAIMVNGLEYEPDENLLVVGYLKQKHGPAPIRRAYKIGYGGSYLEEAEGHKPSEDKKQRYTKR